MLPGRTVTPQRHRSLSTAKRNLVEQLRSSLVSSDARLRSLEDSILDMRIPEGQPELLSDNYDCEKAQLYFHLYTVPVLEAARLLTKHRHNLAIQWGAIQLCLGLHLRYIDCVIDGDLPALDGAELLRRATGYLAQAHKLLQEGGHAWTPRQAAVYSQFTEYEREARLGHFHDFNTLWRRVSPIGIVGETYLQSMISAPSFHSNFRNYLGWTLLHCDCNDVLDDLAAKRQTPVTILVGERMRSATNLSAAADVIRTIRRFLSRQAARMLLGIGTHCPLWRHSIRTIQTAFDSGLGAADDR